VSADVIRQVYYFIKNQASYKSSFDTSYQSIETKRCSTLEIGEGLKCRSLDLSNRPKLSGFWAEESERTKSIEE